MGVVFSEKGFIEGIPGNYPLTAENLFRVGLALCTLLILDRNIPKPVLSIEVLNFATLSLSVGFMNGGGDVVLGKKGDLRVVCKEEGEKLILKLEQLSETDVKKLESLLFGRHPIPKKTGREIGRFRF